MRDIARTSKLPDELLGCRGWWRHDDCYGKPRGNARRRRGIDRGICSFSEQKLAGTLLILTGAKWKACRSRSRPNWPIFLSRGTTLYVTQYPLFACNSYGGLSGVRNVGSLYAGRLSPDRLPPIITGNSGKDQREWKLANNGFSRNGDNGLSGFHYHSTLAAISSSLCADYNNLDGFDLYSVSFVMARGNARNCSCGGGAIC